jgi:hypothetical protein
MDHQGLTAAEVRYCDAIRAKDSALRILLDTRRPDGEPVHLLEYLTALKNTLGNINNDISFVASLLVKPFLRERFGVEFDAASKPQGAKGIDICCVTADGARIVGEIKTTKPYQPGFGAAQKKEILKDLLRLVSTPAEHRFMFVTDAESYRTLCGKAFASSAPGVEIVDLVGGHCFVCPFWPSR